VRAGRTLPEASGRCQRAGAAARRTGSAPALCTGAAHGA